MTKDETKSVSLHWRSFILPHDLHVGSIIELTSNNKCSIEYYSPSLVACQFSLAQAIPCPFLNYLNDDYFDQTSITNPTSMELANFIYNQSYVAFEFRSLDPKLAMAEDFLT